jgi:hypothetical protein
MSSDHQSVFGDGVAKDLALLKQHVLTPQWGWYICAALLEFLNLLRQENHLWAKRVSWGSLLLVHPCGL